MTRRNRRWIVALLAGALLVTGLLGGAGSQQPEPNRLDLMLARAVARMEQLAAAGPVTDIPLLARSAGVTEGPAGPSDPWVEVIVRGTGAESAVRMAGGEIGSRLGPVMTARIPIDQVYRVSDSPGVQYVEASATMRPLLDTSLVDIGADQLHGGAYNLSGAGVLVAVYDSGIDFTHEDFQNTDGTTRIVAIWDQTVSGTPPSGFGYGASWTESQINSELSSPTGAITQQDITGHGTHVAGIAVGNGQATGGGQPADRHVGVAPNADILIIKGGDGSFQSSRVLDGLSYANGVANSRGQPLVVNLSLGGHSGPHDGQSSYEIGIDNATGAGRVICVAAGNSGDDSVHEQVTLSGGNPTDTVLINVPAFTPETGADNDLVAMDIWYDTATDVGVTVQAPGGSIYGPWNFGDGLPSGTSVNQAEGSVLAANGAGGGGLDNRIILEIRDEIAAQAPAPGNWTVTFNLNSGTGATVDLWIYETAFGPTDLPGTVVGATADYSVASPGTADKPITVGGYVTKWQWTSAAGLVGYVGTDRTGDYALFTSWGPTRDGRTKPEFAAPGQGIMSATSLDMTTAPASNTQDPDLVHHISQGTSQAAPHVTGTVALMLQTDATLTNDQIKGHLIASARTDAFTGAVPNNAWGNGKLDAKGAVDRIFTGDLEAPDVTIGILRNSVLGDYLDLYFIASEALIGPPTVDVSGDAITLQQITTSEGIIYVGDYNLSASGSHTITAVAEDLFGNQATVTRTFSAALIASRTGGELSSADGLVHLTFGVGSIREDGYRIVTSMEGEAFQVVPLGSRSGVFRTAVDAEDGLSPPYVFLPEGERLDRPARLVFAFDPAQLDGVTADGLAVHRWENGRWVYLESYVDGRNGHVEATVDRLGIYRLQEADAATAFPAVRTALEPNYPNPFNGSTQVRFTLAQSSEVELFVLNVRGQRVRTLLNGMQSGGGHVVGWDGRGEAGGRLSSGVYLLVLRVNGRVFTRKALLLQ
jgi:subtilisin family serine protease